MPPSGDGPPTTSAGPRSDRPAPSPWITAYPLVFSLFPPLFFYAHNLAHFDLGVLWLPCLGSVGFAALLWALLYVRGRSAAPAALRAWLVLFAFFAAGRMALSLTGTPIRALGAEVDGSKAVWIGFALVVLTALRLPLPRDLGPVSTALALFSGLLVLLPLSRVVSAEIERARAAGEAPARLASAAAGAPGTGRGDRPHIFYLVLDGYAREDVLRDLYGHDNRGFLDGLHDRGCHVASRAFSNYAQTALSLSSALNMDYVDAWTARLPPDSTDRSVLTAAINDNRVARDLRSEGYRFVAFATGYDAAEATGADRFESGVRGAVAHDAFLRGFLASAPVPLLLPLRQLSDYELHRRHILYTLDRLPALAAEEDPLFVLAHVVAPHPPFVFEEDGRVPAGPRRAFALGDADGWRATTGQPASEYRRRYLAQLRYINRRTLETIDAIRRRERRPTVVLVQGDHGPGSEVDLRLDDTNHLERMAILSAFCFPDRAYDRLHPSITPVNSFRVVLGQFLGRDLPLLPDRILYSSSLRPYAFRPLTEGASGGLHRADER